MADPLNLLNFDDWFNNYQVSANSDVGQNRFDGPNQEAHNAYDMYAQAQYPLGDPRSLPQGFMQSGYGPSYQSVLGSYNNPNYDQSEDPYGYTAWLRNAPRQFSAGRSMQDWLKPSSNVPGVVDAADAVAMAAASAATSGAFGAGVAAIDKQGMSPSVFPNTVGAGGAMPTYGTNMPVAPGSSGLFDNLLGTVGNLSPALLAGYLGNSQRQDVMGQVGRINDVAGSLSGPAFMQSITNPYDLQTGQGRTALSQSLQQRGVGGSSFGNQQLGNYDYQRGLGRGDLATRAGTAVAGTQGQLYSDALRGIVGGNAAYNSLLGAGLGASGSLFNRPGGSAGLGGSLSGIGSAIGNIFGGGIPTLPGAPPNFTGAGVDQYGNPIGGSNFSGGTGAPDGTGFNDYSGGYGGGTSGNGLFDWLNQSGAGGDLGLNF